MGIKWDEVFAMEKAQFEAMGERERFEYFLLLQYGSPYRWGKENPEGSDCSGSVALALFAATGFLIRTTADDLFKRVFTVKYPGPRDIRAAFFVAEGSREHGGRFVPAGTAVHVAGLVDDEVILNSQEPRARVRSLASISAWFKSSGCSTQVRGLDRGNLEKLAREGKTLFDVDGELARYFVMKGDRV